MKTRRTTLSWPQQLEVQEKLPSSTGTGNSSHDSGHSTSSVTKSRTSSDTPPTLDSLDPRSLSGGGGAFLEAIDESRDRPLRRPPLISAKSARIPASTRDGGRGEGGGESAWVGARTSGERKQAMSRRWRASSERSALTPRKPLAMARMLKRRRNEGWLSLELRFSQLLYNGAHKFKINKIS